MNRIENVKKSYYPGSRIKYVVYALCRKCKAVNVPENEIFCASCKRKALPIDNYHTSPKANYRTKKCAAQCGALPWIYRRKQNDNEMCYLKYLNYEISVFRSQDRTFSFYAGNTEKNVVRKHIPELVFARTRSVRALAKIIGITFDELVAKIKESSNKKGM